MGQQGIEIARLDHLGIVAGLRREIGIADYLDARDAHTHERVSVGNEPLHALVIDLLGPAVTNMYQSSD